MVLQDCVGIVAVAKIDGNVCQRRSDQGMNARVGHECQGVCLGAKHQGVETVIQGDRLGADLATGVQESTSIIFRWPGRAKPSLRRASESHGLGLFESEFINDVSHLRRKVQEPGWHVKSG